MPSHPPPGPTSEPLPKRRRGWIIGCSSVLLVAALACGAGIWFAFDRTKDAVEVIQAQASALGQGDVPAACRLNSAALHARQPCAAYAQWLAANAAYFAGGTVSMQSVHFGLEVGTPATISVPIYVTGPRGSGHLTFVLVQSDDGWRIQDVHP
jgi:hypothetical protein